MLVNNHSDFLYAVNGSDSDCLDVKWNSFFFDFRLSGDLLSFLANTCAFFLRFFLADLLVDNPGSSQNT